MKYLGYILALVNNFPHIDHIQLFEEKTNIIDAYF